MTGIRMRTLAMAGCGLVLAGWMLGSTLSPPVAQTQERRPAAAPVSRVDRLPAIEPLHDLAAATRHPAAPAPTRNPFAFGRGRAATSVAASDIAASAAAATASSSAETPTAVPAWTLLGVAVDAEGVVTGIVGGMGDVHLVRAGDALPGGVAVDEVTPSGARLRLADGTALDLRLP